MKNSHGGKRPGAGRPKGKGPYGEETKPIRIPINLIKPVMKFINNNALRLPIFSTKVAAGFPSPADDHIEDHLDLNEHLIKHPAATFLMRVTGNSMINAGINENDILIVDRSLPHAHGKIVVAAIDGQLTVKRLHVSNGKLALLAENPDFPPLVLDESNEIYIWGVVSSVIHMF